MLSSAAGAANAGAAGEMMAAARIPLMIKGSRREDLDMKTSLLCCSGGKRGTILKDAKGPCEWNLR
ncbi:Hypothetical protein BFF96_2064 [Corynebacterium pseudotuberculosis]|nr:Hypothetical protein BFF96_2064 [Corynebacterium pseudotuberculosis]